MHALDLDLLNIHELAALLRRTPSTIRTQLTPAQQRERPHTLPPVFRVPGSNRLFWRRMDVETWLGAGKKPGKKRGRPTKAEQLARQAQRDPHTIDFIAGRNDAAGGEK